MTNIFQKTFGWVPGSNPGGETEKSKGFGNLEMRHFGNNSNSFIRRLSEQAEFMGNQSL